MRNLKSAVTMMVALAAVVAFNAAPARAADVDMAAKVAAAKTAADHEAIADVYTKEAADAEASAAEHDKMAATYKQLGKTGLYHEQHCAAIAKRYREQAKDFKALAAAERDLAKKPK